MDGVDTNKSGQETGPSPISEMFKGRSVFITGASGFIGRVLVAKLLNSYQDIKCIYILMRPKRNRTPLERLNQQLFQLPIFDQIKNQPNSSELLAKVHVIPGDLEEPWLGIGDEDMDLLTSDPTLSIIFHIAATVKFNEQIRTAIKLNLIATRTVIDFCRRLPKLISLCHVSTAYVQADASKEKFFDERLYPMRDDPDSIIQLANILDDESMELLQPILIDKRPNTYTYSKALAEHMIAKEASDLPVSIIRPSLVLASWNEPIPGWVDNINGSTGLMLAIGKGLMRTMYARKDCVAPIVPVDLVANTMIAATYYTAKKHNKLGMADLQNQLLKIAGSSSQNKNSINNPNHITTQLERGRDLTQPFIVHCSTGQWNSLRWGEIEELVIPIIRDNPCESCYGWPAAFFTESRYLDYVQRLTLHYFPAILIDLGLWLTGQRRFALNVYGQIHSTIQALEPFVTNDYNFRTQNIHVLIDELSHEDRKTLRMSLDDIDWFQFCHTYVIGTRRYILREKDSTLPESRLKMKRIFWFERVVKLFVCLVMAYLCFGLILPAIFN